MDVKAILDAIAMLIDQVPGSSARERVLTYSAIRSLCQELEEANKLCQYATGRTAHTIAEFLGHCGGLAGLSGDGQSVEAHTARARSALAELRSDTCLLE
jgi:hypothetical protein